MKNRQLKVRSGHYDYSHKGKHLNPPAVPFVLLKGYWLEQVNFEIGKTVQVEVKGNQLILSVE